MIDASTTDPAVGASTWASGSQVCSGNIGTFTAKARKNAPNSHIAPRGVNSAELSAASYEKFGSTLTMPSTLCGGWCVPRYTMPTSISSEPSMV